MHYNAAISCILLLLFFPCAAVHAHDPGLSTLSLRRSASAFDYRWLVADADLPPARRAATAGCDASRIITVRIAGRSLPATGACRVHDAQHTLFAGSLQLQPGTELSVDLELLAELPRGHVSFTELLSERGERVQQQLLRRERPHLRLQSGAAEPATFFRLGLEHIARGLDHLLFVALLVLGVSGWRRLLALVSCFSLAHCATLALATFGLVHLPRPLVEASIAASIVWVAARHAFGAQRRAGLASTFGFGLCHGLGFASELRALGVAGPSLASLGPLAAFHVGIEVAQLAWGALLLAGVAALRGRRGSALATRALSGAALCIGVVWLWQRASGL